MNCNKRGLHKIVIKYINMFVNIFGKLHVMHIFTYHEICMQIYMTEYT